MWVKSGVECTQTYRDGGNRWIYINLYIYIYILILIYNNVCNALFIMFYDNRSKFLLSMIFSTIASAFPFPSQNFSLHFVSFHGYLYAAVVPARINWACVSFTIFNSFSDLNSTSTTSPLFPSFFFAPFTNRNFVILVCQ